MNRSRRLRARGMTLVELLIAMGLSVILVTVASFVFMQANTIFRRVGGRLETAQGFRLTASILDADCARMEPPLDTAKVHLNTGDVPFLTISQGQVPGVATPDGRADELRFVTRTTVSTYTQPAPAPPATPPPLVTAERLVLVTYKLDMANGQPTPHGLTRTVDLLVPSGIAGVYDVNNSLLPNNSGGYTGAPKPLVMEVAPNAKGFRVRWCMAGAASWLEPTSTTASGSAFWHTLSPAPPPPNPSVVSTPPTGIEVTIYVPEPSNQKLRMSVTRTVEVLAPH